MNDSERIYARVSEGLRYLVSEFSCEDYEFERDVPSNGMLLGGLVSYGYARQDKKTKRFVATEAGRKRLKDSEVSDGQDD